MSSKFESSVRQIPYSQELVYNTLSNLENLEKVKDRLPKDQINNLSFDNDSISISAGAVGSVKLRIIERTEFDCIKFEAQESPLPFNFWIQILPVTSDSCKMKLTIKAEISMFLKPMVSKPLNEGIEKLADILQKIPYGQ